MAVGGLSVNQNDHAQRMADAALEMIDASSAQVFTEVGGPLRLRIGLHTGPVVGGVIGQKRFIYDIWGDTVNLASRMQTRGMPGRVQVSQATFRRLRREYELEEGPAIQLGGHREERAYYLIRPRKSAST
jgi:class 3 adenylate cyclase